MDLITILIISYDSIVVVRNIDILNCLIRMAIRIGVGLFGMDVLLGRFSSLMLAGCFSMNRFLLILRVFG